MQEMKFLRFYFLDLKLSRKARGFTLTELMVVVGIMTIMNLLIFANYPEFSQRLALKRTSEDVALIVRQAQAYSLGIKRPLNDTGDNYAGFGVHFDKSEANKKSLIIFADKDDNNIYDAGSGCGNVNSECFQEYKINTGDVVSEVTCDKTCLGEGTSFIDIFYPRANPVATINNGDYSYAEITIQSPKKKTRIIKVWISGQVSIKDGLK